MNKTPLVEFVYNRHKTASATKEAAVELRVTFERKQKYMTTGVRLLPKQWHRGTVTNRVDAIQLNQTLEKLMIDVRQVVVNMMTEGSIDIFTIPDRLKRLRSGNINFLDFCDKRMKIRQYGKAEDSQERYTRFMKFFRGWGKIAEFEDITDLNIIALDEHLAARGLKPYSKWNNYHRFLNSFILDAIDEGYIKRNPYKWVRIEKEKSKGGIGKYLSPQEFTKVRDMELPTESLQRVRDLFVFQTYTCLSYVDLSTFDAEKIEKVKGMKVYIGTRAKTSQTLLLLFSTILYHFPIAALVASYAANDTIFAQSFNTFSTAREDTPSFMAISAAVTLGFSLIAEMIAWFFSELFSEPEPFFSEPMALFSVVITVVFSVAGLLPHPA